mmetsp:Transcript_25342/g.28994  ORF Transcript_25342/g.28994 Transcript_25342/m.28994 type:complete len:125 (+) Transcript_25342:3-377(+)
MSEYKKSLDFRKMYKVTSLAQDHNRKTHIDSIEAREYPFYGVQFHPEKAPFEWSEDYNFIHNDLALKISHNFSQFFVGETRKSEATFESSTEEKENLIYAFDSKYTGKYHHRVYYFDKIPLPKK